MGHCSEANAGELVIIYVDLGYTELFHIPAVTSVSFLTSEGFLGDFSSIVKQIKAPYLFDWEQGIALHSVQGNRTSSLSEGEVSWFFSSCAGTWSVFSSYGRGSH